MSHLDVTPSPDSQEHTIVSLGKPTRTEPGRKGGGAGFNLLKAYSSITLARPLGLPHRAGTTIVRVVEARNHHYLSLIHI